MRRYNSPRLLILLLVAFAVVLPQAHLARANHRSGPCDLHFEDGETIRSHSKRLIRCAVVRWPVKGGAKKAICIARRESNLIPTTTSATGKYLGLFQHYKKMWPPRRRAWTHRSWALKKTALNGRTNAIVTIRMVSANGWGPWKGAGC